MIDAQGHFPNHPADSPFQAVGFYLNSEEFAAPIVQIREIIRFSQITYVPRAPEFIEGVINLRGKIIPIIDLRKQLGFGSASETRDTRIMVMDLGDDLVGIIVDKVTEVLQILPEELHHTPESLISIDSKFVKALVQKEDRLIILIDFESLLKSKEKALLHHFSGGEPSRQTVEKENAASES